MYSISHIYDKTVKTVQHKVTSDLALGRALFNERYPGEWSLQNGELYKGNQVVNNHFEPGVAQIADSSVKVSELAQLTTKQAEEGGKVVTNTVNQMKSIYGSVMESNTVIQSLNERLKK